MFDGASFGRELSEIFQAALKVSDDKIAALEARIMAMESHVAELKYCGVWGDGKTYKRGNSCTHDGSIWIALRDTEGRPGQCLEWQLAVRRGGKSVA